MTSNIYQSLAGWKCPIHGVHSNLNRCAWPDCEHGLDQNSCDAMNFGSNKTKTFHRVSWCGLGEGVFHDWQTDVMPSWFGVSRPYEYFRSQITKDAPPDQMFHYTSVDGALAILQTDRLRFTDYAYLNDTREVTYGLDVIRSVLGSDLDLSVSQALTKLASYLKDGNPFSPYNIYTASFSSESDSLSQFRLYGPVSLGFEASPIGFGFFKGDSHLAHVVYDSTKQAQLIKTLFNLLKQSEEKDAVLVKSDVAKQISTDYIIDHLLRIVAFFKHPAFSDEREMRIMYSEPLEIMDKVGKKIARRQFRTSGGLIAPFTDTFDMMNPSSSSDEGGGVPKKLPLKSVVIGPVAQAEALASGIRDLLSEQGYPDVEVSLSEAPFRA